MLITKLDARPYESLNVGLQIFKNPESITPSHIIYSVQYPVLDPNSGLYHNLQQSNRLLQFGEVGRLLFNPIQGIYITITDVCPKEIVE